MTPILSLSKVYKTFGKNRSEVHALQNISLDVISGECLAIVGESGSGKTTLANLVLGVFPQTSGEILLDGLALPVKRSLVHRKAVQLVQQNPLSSLNPKRSIGASVRLGLDVYGIGKSADRWQLTEAALQEVGLPPGFRHRSPASLSGGERQRVAIARALVCQSRVVVLDEPTSALDVLVQARVLRLLDRLRHQKGLTYLFITHDLSVVRNIADRVAVFQAGKLIECADTTAIFNTPEHEYTRSLIAAVPVVSEEELELRANLAMGNSHE